MARAYASVDYNRAAVHSLGQALSLDSQDIRIIQDAIDAKFRQAEHDLFVSEGASGGDRWSSLSPYYAAFKKAEAAGVRRRNRATRGISMERHVSQKILRWSENMMRSLTRAGHAEHVSQAEGPLARPQFVVGTTNELAHYHYTGRSTPNYMPARNPIAHTRQQKDAYFDVIIEYVVKKASAVARSFAKSGTARGIAR